MCIEIYDFLFKTNWKDFEETEYDNANPWVMEITSITTASNVIMKVKWQWKINGGINKLNQSDRRRHWDKRANQTSMFGMKNPNMPINVKNRETFHSFTISSTVCCFLPKWNVTIFFGRFQHLLVKQILFTVHIPGHY